MLAVVAAYNADPNVHGILVQLPMPKHIGEERVLSAIDYEKDVDGFHPLNIGRLSQRGREPLFVPCTPRGCIELASNPRAFPSRERSHRRREIERRRHAGGALVTETRRDGDDRALANAESGKICRRADIVIAACGQMEMVKGWLAARGDRRVGINAKDDATKKRGYRLVGDVEFETAKEVAGHITPVPGGVGPMTIARFCYKTRSKAPSAPLDSERDDRRMVTIVITYYLPRRLSNAHCPMRCERARVRPPSTLTFVDASLRDRVRRARDFDDASSKGKGSRRRRASRRASRTIGLTKTNILVTD